MKLTAPLTIALLVAAPQAFAVPKCKISRSPYLMSKALPPSLRCQYDQDGNGLDDEVEREIAACVAPAIVFDSAEQHVLPGEPHALFTANAESATEIRLRYVYLFRYDGGPTLSGGLCANDSHPGDTQPATLKVKISKALSGWYAEPVFSLDGHSEFYGTHPKIYATAGKHHFKGAPGMYEYSIGGCDDRADGLGEIVIPGGLGGSLGHIPALIPKQVDLFTVHGAPLTPLVGGAWSNACRWIEDGIFAPATGFQSNNLGNLGYPGQYVTGSEFYDVDPPSYGLKNAWNADPDGDGQRSGYEKIGFAYFQPTDTCPWVFGPHTDADNDDIGSGCDPDEFYRNVYVAGGSAQLPTYDPDDFPGPWIAASGAPTGPRGGFLDLDQDGRVRGDDACPASAPLYSSNYNRNRWGEVANQLDAPSLQSYYRDRGRLERADRCDPYPAPSISFDAGTAEPTNTSGGPCSIVNSKSFGDTTVKVDVGLNVGISDDDPILDQSNPQPSTKTYRVQVYRCACVGYAGEACLDDPASDCYRGDVTAGGTSVGRGWRPVQRPGCTEDRSGWCLPFEMSVTPGTSVGTSITWAWADELVDHPNHFAPGDFQTSYTQGPLGPSAGHAKSNYAYVLWAQVETGLAMSSAPGPHPHGQGSHSAVWPDPETVDWGLLDVSGVRSRRLRAAHTMPQYLSEPYTVTDFGGNLCAIVNHIKALEIFWLPNWPDFHDRFASHLPYVRMMASESTSFTDQWVVDPGLETAYTMSAPSWVQASSGKGVFVVRAPHTIAQGPAAAQEPAVLWVDGDQWALLVPTSLSGSSMSYAIAQEGTLPGTGTLVADERGHFAALVDFAGGKAWLFDPSLGDFAIETDLAAVAGRTDAAVTLVGADLFVVGGALGRIAQTDVWRLPLAGGAPVVMTAAAPVRLGARLSLAPDGASLLLLGGAQGSTMHDDVHRLDLASDGTVTSVRLVAPDTASASTFVPAESVLYGGTTQVRAAGTQLSRTARTVGP